MAKIGRPSSYKQEIADEMCAQIVDGKSLRTICKSDEMPSLPTFFKWLRDNEFFLKQYTRAKQEQSEAFIEDMLEISDNQADDILLDSDGKPVLDKNGKPFKTKTNPSIQHARLRVDTRKWIASKLKPKKYGEKIDSNPTINKIKINFTDPENDD